VLIKDRILLKWQSYHSEIYDVYYPRNRKNSRKIKSVTMISIVLNAIRIQVTEKQIHIVYYNKINNSFIQRNVKSLKTF
jgi:hypothetical protein